MKTVLIIFSLICLSEPILAQSFTHQDTLRGSITKERAWWDLTYYNLDVTVNPYDSTLSGSNTIHFTTLNSGRVLQIDLQKPMKITSVTHKGKKLKWKSDGAAHFIRFRKKIKSGRKEAIQITYEGKPTVSERPPWSGGFTWKFDKNGNPFVATSVQGEGASMFWPNKDHMYDEPDSMTISITAPNPLIAVANGRLRSKTAITDSLTKYEWHVSNPINSYGVNINIGDYVNFSETYFGERGKLDCSYWVLSYNLDTAKVQFKDARRTLEAFEYWFGPYPFYEDSYKLVEVPYLGMEHQSSVTYGNGFQNGYRGRDLSGTGWGLNFDFIIVHESGHEWFANNITYKDMADMWIHESFTNYSESLFLEYHYGKKAGYEYVRGLRASISNDEPIIAPYNVNASGSGDMYYKGANMLHTIRQLASSDSQWRSLLRSLNDHFYHQTVTTQDVEIYMSNFLDVDLDPIFDQYLRDTRIPVFQYRFASGRLYYRWNQVVDEFNLPIKISINGNDDIWLKVTSRWNVFTLENEEMESISVNPNFYVIPQNMTVESSF